MAQQTIESGTAVPVADAIESARSAGLVYVTDSNPGIGRRRRGKGFSYHLPDGRTLTDRDELKRIRSLVIPPAWTDVWISPESNGHLQATGKDSRGRKQYLYHRRWREVRDQNKFSRLADFGAALPEIRRRVDRNLNAQGMQREKIVSAVIALLDRTLIRIGNEAYARENNSFGLTTLQNRHVEVSGSQIRFDFRGKSGIEHVVDIRDRKLAKVVKSCLELPGQELFQYVDEDGERRTVGSTDVNEFLRELTGSDFTAKDFRTWGGTKLAAGALWRAGPAETKKEAESRVVQAIDEVAGHLGNTRAVCRSCYIHPAVVEAYMDGTLFSHAVLSAMEEGAERMDPEEAALVVVLREEASARNGERSAA